MFRARLEAPSSYGALVRIPLCRFDLWLAFWSIPLVKFLTHAIFSLISIALLIIILLEEHITGLPNARFNSRDTFNRIEVRAPRPSPMGSLCMALTS